VSTHARPWCTLIALVLVVSACATGRDVAPEKRLQARAAYERGLSHMRDQRPSLAITALQEAASIDANEPLYQHTLGLLLLQLRRPDLALERFQEATKLDPAYGDAYLVAGTALAEMARWDDAVTAYRRALAQPTLAQTHVAHQNLGVAFYNLRRYREAEESLRFAISLEPSLESAYYNLGLVFVAENRIDEAKAAFRQARTLAPESAFGQAALERLKALGEGG
jgi:Tfp pilus assembly protein PilF